MTSCLQTLSAAPRFYLYIPPEQVGRLPCSGLAGLPSAPWALLSLAFCTARCSFFYFWLININKDTHPTKDSQQKNTSCSCSASKPIHPCRKILHKPRSFEVTDLHSPPKSVSNMRKKKGSPFLWLGKWCQCLKMPPKPQVPIPKQTALLKLSRFLRPS